MDIQMTLVRTSTRRLALAGLLAAGALVLGACSVPGVYVAEKNGASTAAANGAPDPKAYAKSVWADKVVPTITDKAVDAKTVVTALRDNADAAKKQYGVESPSGAIFVIVKGTGKVTAIEEPEAAGTLAVDVTGDGKPDLGVAIGPVFLGTALRDSVGFIDFNSFTNQIDYATVADALNDQVRTTVVKNIDRSTVTGKTVTFAGAAQLLDPKNIVVTPVTCEVK
jgi:predicted lipoprotein